MHTKKRNLIFIIGTLLFLLCFTGCGKKKKISYGDMPGVASGTIDLSGEDAKINIDNIISPLGSDIDYTSGIDMLGTDGDYSVEVNASNVKYDKPGTYTVGYKVKSGNETYTSNVKVTISDDESLTVQKPSQNVISSQTGENVNITGGNSEVSQGNENAGEPGNNQTNVPSVPDNPGAPNEPGNQDSSNQLEEPSKELITDSNSPTYKNKSIQNAVIELLSGDVVTISCSTNKYIIATRTDESVVEKKGQRYRVSKLVIVFNTGDERTLETIEKKID